MPARPKLAAALCALVVILAAAGAARAADPPDAYVALGDSFTAGPFIPAFVGHPAGCGRSDHNYPTIVAAATGAASFDDRSCSSAETIHMTVAQPARLGTNPPQFDGLRAGTTLVTVGIGGNDVGLVSAAITCVQLGLLAPTGSACRSNFAKPDGGDRLADAIDATAPKIAATLQGIHARSPLARVLLVGYPAVAPRDGTSCYPFIPLSDDDVVYLEGMLRRTNAMLAEQAAANDAEYVDTYEDTTGHDACKSVGTRWFEGLVPTSPAFPVHPNALGEASMARSVLRVLGRPRPGPVLGALKRAHRTISAGRALRVSFTVTRATSVAIGLQRAVGNGRYSSVRTLASVDAQPGATTVTLTARQLGRRAGLYRVSAALADGTTQRAQFRIRRAR